MARDYDFTKDEEESFQAGRLVGQADVIAALEKMVPEHKGVKLLFNFIIDELKRNYEFRQKKD